MGIIRNYFRILFMKNRCKQEVQVGWDDVGRCKNRAKVGGFCHRHGLNGSLNYAKAQRKILDGWFAEMDAQTQRAKIKSFGRTL